MKYARFKTEDDLLKAVLHSIPYDAYPKVSAVGGKRINPDIDILEIKKLQGQSRLIGYEVKLLKFDKRSKGIGWGNFYKGIGQTLLHLKNGVHRSALVFGFHESITDDRLIDKFCDWLKINKELLKRIIGSHVSVGLHLYERGSVYFPIEAGSDFYYSDEKVRLLSEEMLQMKFTFNKKLKGA